jgi:hypothetical protein
MRAAVVHVLADAAVSALVILELVLARVASQGFPPAIPERTPNCHVSPLSDE